MKSNRERFWLALERAGIDKPKCRFVFKENGKYGEPEMWIYPKETGSIGTLCTNETIEDIDYLREYIRDFIYEEK